MVQNVDASRVGTMPKAFPPGTGRWAGRLAAGSLPGSDLVGHGSICRRPPRPMGPQLPPGSMSLEVPGHDGW